MVHNPSGIRVSPEKGIRVGGVDYRLSSADVEILPNGVLGSGAGGVVQVGLHKPSGMRVAIKTLKVGDSAEKREQIVKEIQGLAEAEGCPYLIQWYAGFVDRASGAVHVVVELMDRGSLADLRKRQGGHGVPAKYVACIAAQIILGLRYLQTRSILHRDIKPENILHGRDGSVKLTDFGISKSLALASAAVGTTFVGTATYMAPERAGGGDYSFASDVWSAGMVLFELAAGRYPLPSASFPELYEALCERPEPRLEESPEHPPALRDLVARCLTRDITKRPDAVMLAAHEIVEGFVPERDLVEFAAFLAKLPE